MTNCTLIFHPDANKCITPWCTVNYKSHFIFLHSQNAQQLAGQRMVLFSYGSGLASSMYSLRASQDASPGSRLETLVSSMAHLQQRLESRSKAEPKKFEEMMKLREETHHIGKREILVLSTLGHVLTNSKLIEMYLTKIA